MENIIAYHCAPALAGIKPSNLVSIYTNRASDVHKEIDNLNAQLNCKDIYIEVLCECPSRVLALVYRKNVLEKHLNGRNTKGFLKMFGYNESGDIRYCLNHLKEQLSNDTCFPHEIGVFLGYPLHDIYGFIKHRDVGCLLCGEWRVYKDAENAKKMFSRYRACRKALSRRVASGHSLAGIFCAA